MSMPTLVAVQGPDPGRAFPLEREAVILGRQQDSDICLPGRAVSRRHARVIRAGIGFIIEDLDSSNGTFVNGRRLAPHAPSPLTPGDKLQIGPYVLALRTPDSSDPALTSEENYIVRETVNASSLKQSFPGLDPTSRLHVVLQVSQNLARTLSLDDLLAKLLEQILHALPQADRVMAIVCEADKLSVKAQRERRATGDGSTRFSRTIVRRALDEGVGIISDDVKKDERFQTSATLTGLDLHSVMCVPLITSEGARLGVLQADRLGKGFGFRSEDLQLMTIIALQAAIAMENVALHAEQLREERLRQELAMAREIQESYLPEHVEGFEDGLFEIHGEVFPAREVAGDLFDFFQTPSGKLAFFIGDVSGKGMPAALFMVAVRTLLRHLGKENLSPGALLAKLNDALADDNAACMFVTLLHGIYDPDTGHMTVATAGHPPPFLIHAAHRVEPLVVPPGRLLGYPASAKYPEVDLQLLPGDTLACYTDGLLEARSTEKQMFGKERIEQFLRTLEKGESAERWAERTRDRVQRHTGVKDLQDDLTLLFLRRRR
jgi:sigma-B regulation protein RsbU (phosphoserine phosphatase)